MAERASTPRNATSPPATATATARPSLSPLRQRPLGRANTLGDISSSAPHSAGAGIRRRSSFLTADSFDRASIRSSTDSLLLPRLSRHAPDDDEDHPDGSSHLHSIPLALALLPAVGGLFFQNGSAVFTDVTLLVLAAIFLNWSVRLPWDWYHSAQSIRLREESEQGPDDSYFPPQSDTIVEESSQDDRNSDADASPAKSPAKPSAPNSPTSPPNAEALRQHTSAARELRWHELAALYACFACPLLGAGLLHYIRGSLSRPSEGLVSDYNLSIFVLASEIRPLSHLLRIIQSRTLHLQRVVATNPYATASPAANRAAVMDLQTRVNELEAHIAAHSLSGGEGGPESGLTRAAEQDTALAKTVEGTVRAALQPELDAVTRATRRYEKRATLLGLQTEARLNALEQRVQDAVALAAGAERAQQARRRGGLGRLVDAAVLSVVALGDMAGWMLMLPLRSIETAARILGGGVNWVADRTVGRLFSTRGLSRSGKDAKGRTRERGAHRSRGSGGEGTEGSSSGRKAERKIARGR